MVLDGHIPALPLAGLLTAGMPREEGPCHRGAIMKRGQEAAVRTWLAGGSCPAAHAWHPCFPEHLLSPGGLGEGRVSSRH